MVISNFSNKSRHNIEVGSGTFSLRTVRAIGHFETRSEEVEMVFWRIVLMSLLNTGAFGSFTLILVRS